MSKILLARQSTQAPQKTAVARGRVFKFSPKNIPVVDAKMSLDDNRQCGWSPLPLSQDGC